MFIRNRTFRCVVTIITLLSLSLVIINAICNGHIHKTLNDNFIFHAHPYSKTNQKDEPIKSHHHSLIEFVYYDSITNLLELSILNIILWILVFVVSIFRLYKFLDILLAKLISNQLIRAPPLKFIKNYAIF